MWDELTVNGSEAVVGNLTAGGRIGIGVYVKACTPNTTIFDCGCNNGDTVIGGGGYSSSSNGRALRESRPNGAAWRVTCVQVCGANCSADVVCDQAYAVCVSHAN